MNMTKRPSNNSALDMYLNGYAEPQIHALNALLAQLKTPISWTQVLVIPAYRESCQFLQRLPPLTPEQSLLVIVVVNQPLTEHNTPSSPCEQNIRLWQYAMTDVHSELFNENLRLLNTCHYSLLLVDQFSEKRQLPAKQGVGLARKIGCDIATALIARQYITQRWIYSSDCDAHLPENYFDTTSSPATLAHASAMCFDFYHRVDMQSALGKATRIYENCIKYFTQQLQRAGSPYDFCALGSSLAFNAEHYAITRGFPKRAAGEDFYLLNKLAKSGPLINCSNIRIGLDARLSDRVPFGTGPAVNKMLEEQKQSQLWRYYDRAIFDELAQLLQLVSAPLSSDAAGDCSQTFKQALTNLPTHSQRALEQLGIDNFLQHVQKHGKTTDAFKQSFHQWFDAFRTLRFVRILQADVYPAKPIAELGIDLTPLTINSHTKYTVK